MSEQMDWPTSRGSMAAEWAELSPARRQVVAMLFLGLRDALPEAKQADCLRLWQLSVEAAKESRDSLTWKGSRKLDEICGSGSDPEGLAFIDHMDAIAREAVARHLLPDGSAVFGCISTIPAAGAAR